MALGLATVAAAHRPTAAVISTEGPNPGQAFGPVRVVTPFQPA